MYLVNADTNWFAKICLLCLKVRKIPVQNPDIYDEVPGNLELGRLVQYTSQEESVRICPDFSRPTAPSPDGVSLPKDTHAGTVYPDLPAMVEVGTSTK